MIRNKRQRAEEFLRLLQETTSIVQIQFKRFSMNLKELDHKIQKTLSEMLYERQAVFIDNRNRENTELFNAMLGIIEIVRDSLQHKKLNLLGCKMKIYQERMRQIQFLDIMYRFKKISKLENTHDIDKADLAEKFDFCDQMTAKIRESLIKYQDEIQAMHVDASLPTSMTMSFMTNSIFNQCDVWSTLNQLAAYNIRQDKSLAQVEKSHQRVQDFYQLFKQLKQSDLGEKWDKYQRKNVVEHNDVQSLFNAVNEEIEQVHDYVLKQIEKEEKVEFKRNLSDKVNYDREVQYYFIKLLKDNTEMRRLCTKYQKAMFLQALNDNSQATLNPLGSPSEDSRSEKSKKRSKSKSKGRKSESSRSRK